MRLVVNGHHARRLMVRLRVGAIALAVAIAVTGCSRPATPAKASTTPASRESVQSGEPRGIKKQPDHPSESTSSQRVDSAHDLSADEAMGGHTLERHIGKTDQELVQRLQREPDISSASTYTDRDTAERVIGAALMSDGSAFAKWRARQGRRPNFVLHYNAHETIGRSVRRGDTRSQPCERALVVLRWNDRRQQFYVLTSYPEENR